MTSDEAPTADSAGPRQSTYPVQERGEVLPFVPDHAKTFLDIGCARGGFGAALRKVRGDEIRLVGIEPIPEPAADARRAGYDEVVEGYFPAALAGMSDRFDCITLNDVLEHMPDPWSVCAELREWLTSDGVVVASIPSIQYLPVWWRVFRGEWRYADDGTLDRTHLRFFTRCTMVEMFERAGFEVLSVAGINNWTQHWRRRARPFAPLVRLLVGDRQWLQFVIVAGPRSTPTACAE